MIAPGMTEPTVPGEFPPNPRPALAAFVAYLVVAWWGLVYQLGARRWFFRDDWLFLAGRDGGSLHDVFRAHDVHPGALPVLVNRLMFNLFGLWFTPYLVLIVTLHLGVAVLLRVIMRRAGVAPWLATITSGLLILFGSGEENILWAFQINYVGALLLGLTQLLLADHDQGLGRRDVVAVIAGLGAVMCSGIGPLMVACVGLATLLRRGWVAAAFQAVPPLAGYATWVMVANPARYPFGRPAISQRWDWIREGQLGTLEALGGGRVVAALLGSGLALGLVLIARSTDRREWRGRGSVPIAMLAFGPVFFMLTAEGRWPFGAEMARSSRYLYVGAVMLLPALAVASDAIVRRWHGTTLVLVAVLLVGVPGNIAAFNSGVFDGNYFDGQRQIVLGLPLIAEADQAPAWVAPIPEAFKDGGLTIGWLRELRDARRLPRIDDVEQRIAAGFPIRLGLAQTAEPFSGGQCARVGRLDLSLVQGDQLGLRGAVNVKTLAAGKVTSPPVTFSSGFGETLSVTSAALEVRFLPVLPNRTFMLCR